MDWSDNLISSFVLFCRPLWHSAVKEPFALSHHAVLRLNILSLNFEWKTWISIWDLCSEVLWYSSIWFCSPSFDGVFPLSLSPSTSLVFGQFDCRSQPACRYNVPLVFCYSHSCERRFLKGISPLLLTQRKSTRGTSKAWWGEHHNRYQCELIYKNCWWSLVLHKNNHHKLYETRLLLRRNEDIHWRSDFMTFEYGPLNYILCLPASEFLTCRKLCA